jgi:hypothetical protein
MTECDEVAATLPGLPAAATYSDALRSVRRLMPDESEEVISAVAWSLIQSRGDTQ